MTDAEFNKFVLILENEALEVKTYLRNIEG